MLANIQVLRGFAALAVLSIHIFVEAGSWLGTPILTYVGNAGVDMFFVISGFIMVYTTRGRHRQPVDFFLDRLIRIAPLYWIATAIFLVLLTIGLVPRFSLDSNDVANSFLFVPNIRGDGHALPVLLPGWTLAYELYFYFLFALTLMLRSQAIAMSLICVWFAATVTVGALVSNEPHAVSYFTATMVFEFVAGGFLALLLARMGEREWKVSASLGWLLIGAGSALFVVAAVIVGDEVAHRWRPIAWGGPALLIVTGAMLLEQAGVIWKNRALLLLGDASYSLYLFHLIFLQLVIYNFHRAFGAQPGVVDLVVVALATGLCIAGSVAVHLWFERPMQAVLKSWKRSVYRPRSRADAAA